MDCELDLRIESPPEGWPSWMAHQVREADYVLVVCTPAYTRRVQGQEEQGRRLGASWEGGLITQEIYEAGGRNAKLIPVLFEPEHAAARPPFLQPVTYYALYEGDGLERLYRRLTGQPAVVRPPLGEIEKLTWGREGEGDTA